MRFLALASDYDGTLAEGGALQPETVHALEGLRASGRKVVLVTGRELEDLRTVCPGHDELFDLIVAENGAVLYDPSSRTHRLLAPPPPYQFIAALREKGIPVSAGQIVVSTREPHQAIVVDTIRELGLDLELTFNKGAVMVLPVGTNKGSGLMAALAILDVSPQAVCGIGDGENDLDLLNACECRIAVSNAIDSLKRIAHRVTTNAGARGVIEAIELLLAADIAEAQALPLRPMEPEKDAIREDVTSEFKDHAQRVLC